MTTRKPHPVDIHVGKRLREQRCYAGLSQTALAGCVGITFQQLQKYELAVNRVSASRLWDMAEVLGAPVEQGFSRTPRITTLQAPLHAKARLAAEP